VNKTSPFFITLVTAFLLSNLGACTQKETQQETREIKTQEIKNDLIPNDLKVVSIKPFNYVVFKSLSENRFFVDYYYEEGFFQGNLVLELNSEEVIAFENDPNIFLNHQSSLISKDFKNIFEQRNIEPFLEQEHKNTLITNWKTENK